MADAGCRRNLETGLATFRTAVHNSSLLLAHATIIPLAMIAASLRASTESSNLAWLADLIVPITCLIILINFIYALNRTVEINADNGNVVGYPNLYTFVTATGGILVMAFFTAIDNELKTMDRLTAITLCLGVYLYLLFSMILFKLSQDFDLAGAFLAASFQLFYEKAEGFEILSLLFISMFLASVKCYLLGGKGLVVPNRLPPPVTAMVDTGFRREYEIKLATLRTVVRNSSEGLAYAAILTFGIFGLNLIYICHQHEFTLENLICLGILIGLYLLCHCIYARNRPVDTYDVIVHNYPNLYSFMKGIGGQLVLFAFTALDNELKGINRFNAITLCTIIYLYLVIAMVLLRISEDCDLAGAFLAAAYMLFYENSKGFEFIPLIIISILLASLKSFLVGGENLGDPSDRLPQVRLGGRRSHSR